MPLRSWVTPFGLKSALLLGWGAFACSSPARLASPVTEPELVTSASLPSTSEPAVTLEASASSAVPADSAQKPAPTADAPAACPTGMVLIADDYCTEVEHKCVKQWFAEANKKDVCESFEHTSKCVGTRVPKRFCIDQYEWPNRAGERPEVMNNFYQAQVKCAAQGKRLCTESEWSMACEGPELLPFPYGYERDPNKCNGDHEWDTPNMKKVAARDPEELARLWHGVRSGSQPYCVSGYGVHDLPGNADEVAGSETYADNYRGLYDSVTTGGPWYKGVRNQCRPKIYTHDEGFYYYYLSFRCCAEADGKESDPRVPKQVKRNWDFERVERLAGFTRKQMREVLDDRATHCQCGPEDRRCKTMCGTLLGPGAKDPAPRTPKPDPNPPAHLRSVSTKLQ